ncbi:polysaccharide biosynthesis C-terminal domain-containing protein [Enterococcus casseliflavus]|uniref:oligosaccharide flippase family protein n=1 Tax=Enterococcus casseliflavus TaxID=37734 RepID=UPI0039A54CC6
MNKYKKLLTNSAIFAIGNFGSKLLLLILVPFYTYHLSTSEYGKADLISTTINMLLPLVSLSIQEATLRFSINESVFLQKKVLVNSVIATLLSSFLFLTILVIVNFFIKVDYMQFVFLILILQAFQNVFAQFLRATGKIKIYALNGILLTLVLAASNIVLLRFFQMGIDGYLLSIIVANSISVLFMLSIIHLDAFKFHVFDLTLLKSMLVYTIPLIPNAFMWWLMNASSRYFIAFFLGASVNGLFAVASKIPSVLSMIQTIFFQAWQLSAIDEIDSDNKSIFYSSIFKWLSGIMIIATSVILLFLKNIMNVIVEQSFFDAWQAVPFLLISLIFSSYSSFFGTFYIAAKKTKGIMTTSLYGAVISIVGNLVFISSLGLMGAGISTSISFLFIWILRIKETQDFVNVAVPIKILLVSFILLIIQMINIYTLDVFLFNLIVFSSLVFVWIKAILKDVKRV